MMEFYIYKTTPPLLATQRVEDGDLPWVYDQDPSSGYVARMSVVPADEITSLRAELEAAKAEARDSCTGLNDYFGKQLAARDLVIKQMQEALLSARYNLEQSGFFVNVLDKTIALQPSTEALDKYVAEQNARPDCNTCENRWVIDGLSQETHCEHCVYQESWRTNHYKIRARKDSDV